jgi:hypothetical protein
MWQEVMPNGNDQKNGRREASAKDQNFTPVR